MAFSLANLPFPKRPLREGWSRIEALDGASGEADGLRVKREDEAPGPYGGNKLRKLEWWLGMALDNGGEVLTIGPAGSHWVLATGLYGQAAGIRVQAVLFPTPDNAHARMMARAIHATVERTWPAATRAGIPLQFLRAWLAIRVFGWFPPLVLPAGGSGPVGNLGWVEGGLEIAAQVEAGLLPPPRRIYLPLGTGGTAAGLLLGLRLGGLSAEVMAVDVVGGGALPLRWQVSRTLALLRRHGAPAVSTDGLTVVAGFRGAEYGRWTPEGEAATRVAERHGLTLDPSYTAKAFAACIADPTPGRLFLHTHSSTPMAPILSSALDEVPASLRGLLLP